MSEKSWFDSLSEILNAPLPGSENAAPPGDRPVVFSDDDGDDSLLDRITDILSRPLPGTETSAGGGGGTGSPSVEPENPGEAAVRDAEQADADPVSTTAAAGADWMQREYERFNAHQEHSRQSFADHQRVEQERFAAYQRAQLAQFMKSQERERGVFKRHQESRSHMWRQDLSQAYGGPGGHPPAPMPPGMMPPPPPPWWRKR